jgi:Cysteine-rich secretory protein family
MPRPAVQYALPGPRSQRMARHRDSSARRAMRRAIIQLAVGLLAGAAVLAQPLTASAHQRCPRGSSHSKHAKSCHARKKHKRGKGKHPGRATKPGAHAPSSSKRPLRAGPVNLTPAERKVFEEVNSARAEHKVPAVTTSPDLQTIAEKRSREMAAHESDYAGYDVFIDLREAGFCTKGQREISELGISQAGQEHAEQGECEVRHVCPGGKSVASADLTALPRRRRAAFARHRARAAMTFQEEQQKALEIPFEAKWSLVAIAIAEAGSKAYFVEDFAQPC